MRLLVSPCICASLYEAACPLFHYDFGEHQIKPNFRLSPKLIIMKYIITLLAGIFIGLIADISLYSVILPDPENNDSVLDNYNATIENSGEFYSTAIVEKTLLQGSLNITPAKAYEFFDAYHGISNPSTKKACLISTVNGVEEEITSIYLPYSGFLDVINDRVASHDKSLLGLAGIPAYNTDERSHTLIWVPVVRGPEQGKQYYFIPEQGHEGLLIDYIDICPPTCRENECVLWNEDWKYDTENCEDPFN